MRKEDYVLPALRTYVVAASLAEFLNALVLIVQSFQKVPFLHAYAPKGSEPVVAITQGVALLVFIGMAVAAIRKSAVLAHSG